MNLHSYGIDDDGSPNSPPPGPDYWWLRPFLLGGLSAVVVVGTIYALTTWLGSEEEAITPLVVGDETSIAEDASTTVPEGGQDDGTDSTTSTTEEAPTSVDPPPAGAPSSLFAIEASTGELVEVDTTSGTVIDRQGGWERAPDGTDAFDQALQSVDVGPDGVRWVDDCCEPAFGSVYRLAPGESFDPLGGVLTGDSMTVSPGGGLIAVRVGAAVIVHETSGAYDLVSQLGAIDADGPLLRPLTWVDEATLVVVATSLDSSELRFLRLSDEGALELVASRRSTGGRFESASTRADGAVVALEIRLDGDVQVGALAVVVDPSTGESIAEFAVPGQARSLDYDATGRFLVVESVDGSLMWFGAGKTGSLGEGFFGPAW